MTSSYNKNSSVQTSSINKYVPFQISTTQFHVTSHDHRGHNRIYESKRSKSYFFELDGITPNTNQTHLKIHTNDLLMVNSPKTYFSNSHTLNKKYQISKLLTHFFRSQRVIPKRVQHKYFNFIRKALLLRLTFISNRTDQDSRNRITKTSLYFTYKKYRFHFGIYVPCKFLTNNTPCSVPSPIVLSKNRSGCSDHQKWLYKTDTPSPIDNPRDNKSKTFSDATKLVFEKSQNPIGTRVTSHRTGASYLTKIRVYWLHKYRTVDTAKHIYVKQYSSLSYASPASSNYSLKTLAKQKIRRDRKLNSLLQYENLPRDAPVSPTKLLTISKRHHYLTNPKQVCRKYIQHVKYNHVRYKSHDNYPLPRLWNKSRGCFLTKDSALEEIILPDPVPPSNSLIVQSNHDTVENSRIPTSVTELDGTYTIRTYTEFAYYQIHKTVPHINPNSNIKFLFSRSEICASIEQRSHPAITPAIQASTPTRQDTFCQFLSSLSINDFSSYDVEHFSTLINILTDFQDEVHSIYSGLPVNTLSPMTSATRRATLQEMSTRPLSFKARYKAFRKKLTPIKAEIPRSFNDTFVIKPGFFKRSLEVISSTIPLVLHKRLRSSQDF
ncbi:hypothetical protein C1645_746269 [Glomus cerebriforme]|uniref:DUF8211 domain-containing protein n=1 Tax=Glomus cerebriforme TaxID=658196 RepID=A0A397RX18_9GLOM|nr:hypothetical protein C1645_746269 [Glomus cerebriforme]